MLALSFSVELLVAIVATCSAWFLPALRLKGENQRLKEQLQ